MLDEIRSENHLEGDLDGAQRAQSLKIAARCSVHRTLSSEIKIRTTML
jgi:putative redox protein